MGAAVRRSAVPRRSARSPRPVTATSADPPASGTATGAVKRRSTPRIRSGGTTARLRAASSSPWATTSSPPTARPAARAAPGRRWMAPGSALARAHADRSAASILRRAAASASAFAPAPGARNPFFPARARRSPPAPARSAPAPVPPTSSAPPARSRRWASQCVLPPVHVDDDDGQLPAGPCRAPGGGRRGAVGPPSDPAAAVDRAVPVSGRQGGARADQAEHGGQDRLHAGPGASQRVRAPGVAGQDPGDDPRHARPVRGATKPRRRGVDGAGRAHGRRASGPRRKGVSGSRGARCACRSASSTS